MHQPRLPQPLAHAAGAAFHEGLPVTPAHHPIGAAFPERSLAIVPLNCPDGRSAPPEGRDALVGELEELGFDSRHPSDYDWRALLSDHELELALAFMRRAAL